MHRNGSAAGPNLSYAQEHGYWRLERGEREPIAVQAVLRLDGPLEVQAFEDALRALVVRHDALRLRIARDDHGQPFQRLVPPPTDAELMARTHIRARSEDQFLAYASHVRVRSLVAAWHLSDQPPFRFRLLRHSPELHIFLADFSQLAMDGRGRSVFLRELWELYGSALRGGRPSLPEPAGDLLGAVQRERTRFAKRSRTVSLGYWTAKFEALGRVRADLASLVVIPGEKGHSRTPCHVRNVHLDTDAWSDVRSRGEATGSTEFQWLMSRFAAEVFRSSSRRHLEISVPMDIRATEDRSLLGRFAAPFPLLIPRSEEPDDILRHVKAEIMKTMRHRHISYADMERARRRHPGASPSERGVITVLSNVYGSASMKEAPGGLRITPGVFPRPAGLTSDGIALAIEDRGRQARLRISFDPRDHRAEDADRFTQALSEAVRAGARRSTAPRTPERDHVA
ncbi:condensation domain-containing protein [Streptomyces sp. NPDC051569]|uniref:condensation domain-containing protein n=1 Tax=Streptomyces sp. NPDC051569 TaxID=3365661 RepID=UPI00379FEC37